MQRALTNFKRIKISTKTAYIIYDTFANITASEEELEDDRTVLWEIEYQRIKQDKTEDNR